MRIKRTITANFVLCVIVMAITLVIFFIGFGNEQRTAFEYTALLFVLASEISLFSGLSFLASNPGHRNKVLIRSGIVTTLSGYWIIATVISIFSRSLFDGKLNGLISVQAIVVGITAIVCISILQVSQRVEASYATKEGLQEWLRKGEEIIFCLMNEVGAKPYIKELTRLYEEIKYSDKVSTNTSLDKEIHTKISELSTHISDEGTNEKQINHSIEGVLTLIKNRNKITLQSKRGSF